MQKTPHHPIAPSTTDLPAGSAIGRHQRNATDSLFGGGGMQSGHSGFFRQIIQPVVAQRIAGNHNTFSRLSSRQLRPNLSPIVREHLRASNNSIRIKLNCRRESWRTRSIAIRDVLQVPFCGLDAYSESYALLNVQIFKVIFKLHSRITPHGVILFNTSWYI